MFVLKKEEKKGFLSGLKEATFFVAIYLYFTGFIYIYYFYEEFGIPLRVLDTPVYFFFVYSYNVVKNFTLISWSELLGSRQIWMAIVLLYVLSLIVMAFRFKAGKHLLLFIFLVALFPCLSVVAIKAAKVEAQKTRSGDLGVKEITFFLKTDSDDLKVLKRLRKDIASNRDGANGTGGSKPAPEAGKGNDALLGRAEIHDFERFVNANSRDGLESDADADYPKLYLITETSTTFYVLFQPRAKETALPGYVYEVPKSAVVLSSVRIQQRGE